jgi:hypothetical protein
MAETCSAAIDEAAPGDLISFLKAIPVGEAFSEGVGLCRREVRYSQWFLLLETVLGILSGCRSSRDLEAMANSPGSPERFSWPELQALAIGCHLPLPVQQSPAAGIRPGAAGLDGQPDPRSWITDMASATTHNGTTTRRHLFFTSIHTNPESMLRLIRQRWSIELEH